MKMVLRPVMVCCLYNLASIPCQLQQFAICDVIQYLGCFFTTVVS